MEKHNTIMIIRKMVLGGLPSMFHFTRDVNALWTAEKMILISPIRVSMAMKGKWK